MKGIYNYLAGSTDFGNVSYVVPGIHPFFYICTDALNHTEEYAVAAGKAACVYCEQMFSLIQSDGFPGHLVCLFYLFFTLFFYVPGAKKAQLYTLRTAKALAMTAVDVVCSPDLLRKVREDFSQAKLKQGKHLEDTDTSLTAP